MDKRAQAAHIDEAELVQLAMDELPSSREAEVLGHVADCDRCADLSRRLRDLSQEADTLAPGNAVVRRIAAAVRAAMNWGPRLGETTEELAGAVLGGVLASRRPGATRWLDFSSLPAGASGVVPLFFEPGPELRGVRVRGRSRAPQTAKAAMPGVPALGQLYAARGVNASVEFEERSSELVIRLGHWPAGQPRPRLAIVPREGAPYVIELTETGDSRGYLSATFDKPDGDFIIVFCRHGEAL